MKKRLSSIKSKFTKKVEKKTKVAAIDKNDTNLNFSSCEVFEVSLSKNGRAFKFASMFLSEK